MGIRNTRWFRIVIASGLLLAAADAGWGQSISLDTLPSVAILRDVTATPSEFQGRKALRVELTVTHDTIDLNFDEPTFVLIPADFTDGTIAVDLVGQLNGKRAEHVFSPQTFSVAEELRQRGARHGLGGQQPPQYREGG